MDVDWDLSLDAPAQVNPYEEWGGLAGEAGALPGFASDAKSPELAALLRKLDRLAAVPKLESLEQKEYDTWLAEGGYDIHTTIREAMTACAFTAREINYLNSPLLDGLWRSVTGQGKRSPRDDVSTRVFPHSLHQMVMRVVYPEPFPSALRFLLWRGAARVIPWHGNLALDAAALTNDVETVQLLLDHGASLTPPTVRGAVQRVTPDGPFLVPASSADPISAEYRDWALPPDRMLGLNEHIRDRVNALVTAAAVGSMDVLRMFLTRTDAPLSTLPAAFESAARGGRLDVITLLLPLLPSEDAVCSGFLTAMQSLQLAVVQQLIDRVAKRQAFLHRGLVALYQPILGRQPLALAPRRAQMARLVLRRPEIDVNYSGGLPMLIAIAFDDAEVVRSLLDRGASVRMMMYDAAIKSESSATRSVIVPLLLERGNLLHSANNHAVVTAALGGLSDVVNAILRVRSKPHHNLHNVPCPCTSQNSVEWLTEMLLARDFITVQDGTVVRLHLDNEWFGSVVTAEAAAMRRRQEYRLAILPVPSPQSRLSAFDHALRHAVNAKEWMMIRILLKLRGPDQYRVLDNVITTAVQQNDDILLDLLLQDSFGRERNLSVALCSAVTAGRVPLVKRLIEHGANVHFEQDKTLLLAAQKGSDELVNLLLRRGANPANQANVLTAAVKHCSWITVQTLLQSGVVPQSDLNTSLQVAVERKSVEITRLLVERGADVHFNHDVALRYAAARNLCDIAAVLIQHRADPNANDGEPLCSAVEANHGTMVRLLLEHKANVHVQDQKPLRTAVQKANGDLLVLLLQHGARVRARNEEALRTAVTLGSLDCVTQLLDKGADLHVNNDEPLRIAVERNSIPIAKLLLDRGANVKVDQNTPLRVACDKGHVSMISLLLQYGADAAANSSFALAAVAKFGLTDSVAALLDHGADVQASESAALHVALSGRHLAVVRLLLSRGADCHSRNDDALYQAAWKEDSEMVSLLLHHMGQFHLQSGHPCKCSDGPSGALDRLVQTLIVREPPHHADCSKLCDLNLRCPDPDCAASTTAACNLGAFELAISTVDHRNALDRCWQAYSHAAQMGQVTVGECLRLLGLQLEQKSAHHRQQQNIDADGDDHQVRANQLLDVIREAADAGRAYRMAGALVVGGGARGAGASASGYRVAASDAPRSFVSLSPMRVSVSQRPAGVGAVAASAAGAGSLQLSSSNSRNIEAASSSATGLDALLSTPPRRRLHSGSQQSAGDLTSSQLTLSQDSLDLTPTKRELQAKALADCLARRQKRTPNRSPTAMLRCWRRNPTVITQSTVTLTMVRRATTASSFTTRRRRTRTAPKMHPTTITEGIERKKGSILLPLCGSEGSLVVCVV